MWCIVGCDYELVVFDFVVVFGFYYVVCMVDGGCMFWLLCFDV